MKIAQTTKTIDDLTREQLILIIAEMYDAVQDFDSGYGFTDEDGLIIRTVGSLATAKAYKDGKSTLGKISDIKL